MENAAGGLGVWRIMEFNHALLGKWCWRSLVDREGLWFRVLSSRYDVVGGDFRWMVGMDLLDGGR